MAKTPDQDALSRQGTTRVLTLLVRRQARYVDDDVVGSLKKGTSALAELKQFCLTLASAYWQAEQLSDAGVDYVVVELEPGNHVDRVGVAVYAAPARTSRVAVNTLNSIRRRLEQGVWFVRRRTYELAAEKDFFEERPDLPDDLDPWPGDANSLDEATVALVRARRRNEIFVHDRRGVETLVDVGNVQPFPPTLLREIVIDGLVNGHRWTSSEAHLLGTELGITPKATLAGSKRSYSVKVSNALLMKSVLQISANRERRLWKVEQHEYVVDGGRRKIENRLIELKKQA